GTVFLNHLAFARDGQPVGRYVVRDHRAGRDIGTVADADRRHQRCVRTYESTLADISAVFGHTIVVADDRAGAEVCAGTEPRVADIGEMVGLGAVLDHRLLDLDEVADVHLGAKPRAWPQPRIGTDQGALPHVRMVKMRERADHRVVLDRYSRTDDDERLDHDVTTEPGVSREIDRLGGHQGYAGLHRVAPQTLLQHRFGFGELRLGVDASHVVLLGLDCDCLAPHGPGDGHGVGQIEFALAIVA